MLPIRRRRRRYRQYTSLDLNAPWTDPDSHFLRAADEGNLDAMREARDVDGANQDAITATGMNALHLASKRGHREVVSCLVEEWRVGLDIKTPQGYSAFTIAVHFRQECVCDYLMNHGAIVEGSTLNRCNNVHKAGVHNLSVDCTRRLVESHPRIDAALRQRNCYGRTPLDEARVNHASTELIHLLIQMTTPMGIDQRAARAA
jgi:ankyrin repeat protein